MYRKLNPTSHTFEEITDNWTPIGTMGGLKIDLDSLVEINIIRMSLKPPRITYPPLMNRSHEEARGEVEAKE